MTEVVYVIQNPPDLHKLFVRFSQPKSFNIFRIFDEYERLHAFVSHTIYNIGVRVVSDIQSLAFGSSLYIRYSTAAHVVNSTYISITVCNVQSSVNVLNCNVKYIYMSVCLQLYMSVSLYVCKSTCR